MIEQSLSLSIQEDEPHSLEADQVVTVNAIRDGKLIEVAWNELTDDERRAAHVELFHLYDE